MSLPWSLKKRAFLSFSSRKPKLNWPTSSRPRKFSRRFETKKFKFRFGNNIPFFLVDTSLIDFWTHRVSHSLIFALIDCDICRRKKQNEKGPNWPTPLGKICLMLASFSSFTDQTGWMSTSSITQTWPTYLFGLKRAVDQFGSRWASLRGFSLRQMPTSKSATSPFPEFSRRKFRKEFRIEIFEWKTLPFEIPLQLFFAPKCSKLLQY